MIVNGARKSFSVAGGYRINPVHYNTPYNAHCSMYVSYMNCFAAGNYIIDFIPVGNGLFPLILAKVNFKRPHLNVVYLYGTICVVSARLFTSISPYFIVKVI